MQYRGQMHTWYGPPSSYWIMLFLSVFYTYSQAPTHRISPPTPSIDRNSRKGEPFVLFLLLKMIFRYAIRLNENLMLFILANIEHLFKMLLLKGGQDLYLANYQAQHMLPSVTSFRKYNYNWVRLERSGTFQLLAARIYNLSTVACLRVRYLETYDTLYHCPPNPHFICNTQWVCTVTVNWVNVLQPCKFGLAGGCACAHVQYRRVKVDSMLMWHKITPFPRHCVSVPCNVTRLVTWSLLSCFYPWWRDHCYPGTGAAEQKCCVRGSVTGWPFRPLVRPRLSQLVMASGNTYQCINILKVSTSQLTNSSNHAPWPEQRHGNEKQGRLVLVAVVVAVLVLVVVLVAVAVLTPHLLCSPNNISNATLGHAQLYLYLMSLFIFFLHWIDVISKHHTSQ